LFGEGADTGVVGEDGVEAAALGGGHAEGAAGVGLGVEVDEQNFTPGSARHAARLTAMVVLPTPPFWLAMAMIFMRGELRYLYRTYRAQN